MSTGDTPYLLISLSDINKYGGLKHLKSIVNKFNFLTAFLLLAKTLTMSHGFPKIIISVLSLKLELLYSYFQSVKFCAQSF